MTAQIAWLYAIPVERFLDPYRAAQANITLLAIVSLWRVLLMSRILSVLFEINFERALGWAFMAAALEVIIVFFLGVPFSRHILAAMSGMRNAPEEALLGSVLGFVWECSWVVLVVCFLALISRRFKGIILPLPEPLPGKIPWIQLVGLVGIWALIAIVPQKEQHRFITHAALLEKKARSEERRVG